ncbi:MAG: sugar nucleotide-binding protein, partial [Myxococcales bacterium]|nr:sugar nucleotide-binding protein [Myxococcales bacterium]
MKRSPPVRPVHATPRVDRRSGRLEVWGGVECSVVRVGDVYRSSMQRSGHDRRASDIARIADLGVTALRMPVLWELVAPDGIERADWRWPDERLALAREHGVRPIVGLVHHGSGTRTTSLLDEAFPERLAEYAAAVARRYPWVTDFTPVNEPLTTARFSALYGHWYPHARSAAAFAGALVNECRATVLAMEAIRAITPAARLIQTEDYGHVRSTPRLAYQAEHENQRRWLSLDLLCGRVDEAHPLHGYLRHVGIRHRELAFFLAHRTAPEVIGLNYYLTSERFLDENVEAYPAGLHGGNDIDRYADVEAVRLGVPLAGHAGAISETWTRYRLPLAITEVHLGCTREEQLRWWRQAWRAASRAREFGIDVRAVCAWALFGSHDWGSLLLVDRGDYEVGAFDVRSHPPRPTAIARGIAQVAREGRLDHPVLDVPGWWRRPSRVFYGPGAGTPDPADARARPILIIGATGTLGHALCAACTARGLAFRPLTRAALDVGDPGAVARALDVHRPWAIVNAAGYVRVDDAEDHLEECWRVNVEGARLLAEACAARG